MSKKYTIILIIAYLFILFICGCSNKNAAENDGFSIYYPDKDNFRIDRVSYELQTGETDGQVDECLAMLEKQTENVELRPAITDAMQPVSQSVSDGMLVLDFAGSYYSVTGREEILKRAAMVRTLTQLDGIDGVSFQVEGMPLLDSGDQPIGIMTADMFIDNAGEEINSYERTKLTLYFADTSGEKLVKTSEVVAYSSNIPMEKLVTEHIISGPLSTGVLATVASNTELLSVTTKDGVCYVNLSREFLTKQGNLSDDVVLYSIVNSLTELPNINKVQFMIDGEPEISFGDHSYLNTPLERNLELVVKEGE